ncbi:hypothetical protein [Elizabethkingia anophelis]|uniref:hypothetical protein n=1 Tax=Elizabethkingia anophelis TaxID=1117645 RepID=UPI003208FF3F
MSLIEKQYQHYLEKVQLKESEMPEDQKIETKRAFIAGMSEMYAALVSGIEANMPLDGCLKYYRVELTEYWKQETKNYDEQN